MANILYELLGEKPYTSIPHLPGSKVGPGDHTIDPGTASLFTDIAKWQGPRERIVVQEKVDGTCVTVIKDEYADIIPALRSGHRALESPYEQHHKFHWWVYENHHEFSRLLRRGERVCGEWMAQAHGIVYDRLSELFFAFDIRSGSEWLPALEVMRRCAVEGISTVPLLYYGPPVPLEHVKRLSNRSAFRIKGPAEGVVLRREIGGRRTDICKYVRQDHRAGVYLPDISHAVVSEPVWHEPHHQEGEGGK